MESGSLPEIEEINFTSSTTQTLGIPRVLFYIKQQEFRVRIQGSPYSVESVLLDYYHLIVVYFL